MRGKIYNVNFWAIIGITFSSIFYSARLEAMGKEVEKKVERKSASKTKKSAATVKSDRTKSSSSTKTQSSNKTPATVTSYSTNSTGRKIKRGDTFAYQLDGATKNHPVKVFFVDLFDTSASKISSLKSSGKIVVCYYSAGTYENWRPDVSSLPASVKGRNMDGWAGEKWLNVKSSAVLDLAKSRNARAKSKGCDGVDPDNVDAYGNNTGFSISQADSRAFLQRISADARSSGLQVGLKNSAEIASALQPYFDFAVVEECHKWNECSRYNSFSQAGKAVFQIEYGGRSSSMCSRAKASGATLIFSTYDLKGSIQYCQ
jgi:hypothetical protein